MNNDLRPINTIPNFKRFCMTIGELPTSYLETMTYYEMLVWFTEYMKNTIIPTINNNGLAVEELQNKYIELKSYVDNYFDNLDVQQEINNKLDAMAEDGTLEHIIASYLQTQKIYNTHVEMIADAANLVSGLNVQTLGYYTLNDGGGAFYQITNTKSSTDYQDNLGNGLYATLIINDVVNVKQFGAYGDGIHDDTNAFKKANKFIVEYGESLNDGANLIPIYGIQLNIPNGQYKLVGNDILGSINHGTTSSVNPFSYKIEGNNSTIFWYLNNENDILFTLNKDITSPDIENLSIVTLTNSNDSTNYGIIFKIDNIDGGLASRGMFKNLHILSGRNANNKLNIPKYAFLVEGTLQCDQMLVENCDFMYCSTIIKSTNENAVNWFFNHISATSNIENNVYFDIEKCYDNFIVSNSSFSCRSGQTIIKAICPLGLDNKIYQLPEFNFIFDNNRIELLAIDTDTNFYPINSNYGHTTIRNTNFTLGNSAPSIKSVINLKSHGTATIDNVTFNNVKFLIPCVDNAISGIGNRISKALNVNNVTYLNYELGVNKDNNEISIIEASLLGNNMRSAFFKNFCKRLRNLSYCFDIIGSENKCMTNLNKISYSDNGVITNKLIELPAFQTITGIYLNLVSQSLPTTFTKVRVYFGDPSNEKYIDTTITPSSIPKQIKLFDGEASIIKNDISKQTIKIVMLENDAVASTELAGNVIIEYMPLSLKSQFNKDTSTEEIIIKQ